MDGGQVRQHRLHQRPAARRQVDDDQATVLRRRLAIDMAGGHQAVDSAGQRGAIGPDHRRQGGHRRQAFLVQRVQHQPLAEDDPMLAQSLADQKAAGLFGLKKQSVQIVDIERQKQVLAFPDKLSTQKPGFQMTTFAGFLNRVATRS